MYKYFYLLIFILPNFAIAQNLENVNVKAIQFLQDDRTKESIDLLEKEIAEYQLHNKIDESLIQAKITLARSYMHSWQTLKAEKNYLEAVQMSNEIGHDSFFLETSLLAISILDYLDKNDTVTYMARNLLQRDDLNYKQESNLNATLASSFEDVEQNDSAIYYARIAAIIDSSHQDSSSIPFTYYDLGNYYINNFDYENGIESIIYGMRFLRKGKDDFKRVSLEIGLGEVYYQIGNIVKAQELAKRAVNASIKNGWQIAQTNGYNLLGNCARYNDELEQALKYYMKSDSVNAIKSKNNWRHARAKVAILNTKIDLGYSVESSEIVHLKEIYSKSEIPVLRNKISFTLLRVENNSLADFEVKYSKLYNESKASTTKHLDLSLLAIKKEFYEKKGLFYKANLVDKKLDKLKKEIDQTNNIFIIQELQAKYRKDKQDLEISYLDAENKSKAKIVSQQKRGLLIGSFALGMISMLSFFLYRIYKKVNRQKDTIAKALGEKDILLREIHHRVKNNLQLVSSLLTLQGRSIDDETAIQAINEGKNRVRSMALIHQDLYTNKNLTGVGVKTYLEKLSQELFNTYRIDQNRISLKLDIQDLELDADTLVPLGLIINELITNSVKYAFPEDRQGTLYISLKELNEKLHLIVSDDGVGYELDKIKGNSFGTTLIAALTEQLEGEIITNHSIGTETIIILSDYSVL